MATNPDLNIVDTSDNETLLQLQQAQQIAVSNGNTLLAATLGNAIQTLLLTTPPQPQTVGGINQTTAASVSSIIGGGGTNRGNVTTPGTPVRPGTPGPDLCPNPTYRLGKTKELQVGLSYDPNTDFASLRNAKQCLLIGEIFKCCPDGETFVGWVTLGYATVSRYYENCPDGGLRPVIKQYYDLDSISIGSFVLPYTDNLLLNTIADPFISSTEASNVYRGKWSDECNDNVSLNPNSRVNVSKSVYNTFEEYFNDKYQTGLTLETESRRIENSVVIYNSSNRQNPKQVDSNILRAVKATCEYDGECIKTGGDNGTSGPGPGPCPPDGFFQYGIKENVIETEWSAENAKAIQVGYTRRLDLDQPFTPITSSVEDSPGFEPIPDRPCFEAVRRTTTTIEVGVYGYSRVARPDCGEEIKTIRVTRRGNTVTEYIGERPIQSKIGTPECSCEERFEDAGVLLDPNDPCGCKQYNLIKVYVKCPQLGQTEFIPSTEVYRDGIPVGLNLPPGIKLDPFIPMSLRADCQDEPVKIYHKLVLGKDIVEAKVTSNTRGLFNLSQSISCYLTSSLQSSASKEYYYEVTDCNCDYTPYFAVAYGNRNGSGSLWSSGETNDTATRAIYSQYRLLALEEPERIFKFYDNGTEIESEDIYVMNFYRNGLSDRIDPGNFEISLQPLNGNAFANNIHTGSNVQPSGSTVFVFTDNSNDRSDLTTCTEDPYVSYDIVSGSLDKGIHYSGTGSIETNPNITTYGKFYPNLGIMVFSPAKLNSLLGFNTVTGSNIAGDNAFKLYTSISGSGALGHHIKARNVKYKTTNHYFVRVSPPNANYSNNPTFISSSSTQGQQGKLLNACFQKEPVTYVTSVGLYNDKRELLAVAKLSKPVKKTPDDDLLIKIRLNW